MRFISPACSAAVNRLRKLTLRNPARSTPTNALPASAQRQIGAVLAAQPEAAGWLALIEATLREGQSPAWDVAAAAMLAGDCAPARPLLAGASIPLDAALADGWLRRLLTLASSAAPDAAPLARAAQSSRLEARGLLAAAINGDDARLEALASEVGAPAAALSAVVDLAATPLLQALRRHLAPAADDHWRNGCCPVCGDWPHLAELRGLERARRLRCARCGSDWGQPGVCCPFCAATGPGTRATLVSEQDGEARKVETCLHCRGYLKVVSTLRAWPGDEVCLADLATVDLDLAALERGYARPEPQGGLGVRLE